MNQLYESIVTLFYQLSNAFFWPVAVSLLALFAYALFDLGALIYAMFQRRRAPRAELQLLARALTHSLAGGEPRRNLLDDVALSPALRRFWMRVGERLDALDSTADVDLWLDESLRNEELERTTQLDRSRALVRIGPMLGLAGTIIPLGPALQSLLGGDMASMVNHLVVGFGAVVCGLVLSGVAYYVTLIRERWARIDLKEMEDLCELLMRGMQRREPASAQPWKEARYAGVR